MTMQIKPEIKQWLTDFSGCGGGNIGTKDKPSIWVCGLESSDNWTAENLNYNIYYEKWENNPNFGDEVVPSDRHYTSIFKLLNFVWGVNDCKDWWEFAQNHQIFVQDSQSPYYKMNLYPIASPEHDDNWNDGYGDVTGFKDKDDYYKACQEYRFPAMKQWVQTYSPQLVICLGKQSKGFFDMAFSDHDGDFHELQLDGNSVFYKQNNNGTFIVVLPFLTYTSHDSLWLYGFF